MDALPWTGPLRSCFMLVYRSAASAVLSTGILLTAISDRGATVGMLAATSTRLVGAVGAQEPSRAVSWHIMQPESFGDRLRRYRRFRGFSQAELAVRSATDKGQIGKIETAPSYEPTRDVVRRLARALEIEPWQLEDEDFRPSPAADPLQAAERVIMDSDLPEERKQAALVVIRDLFAGARRTA